jgi:flagellar basal-body rod protein FlgF
MPPANCVAMDSITALAASGMRSRMESLELLANNIANASTGGYKADREFYSLYMSSEAADAGSTSTMPVVQTQWTDYSQGELRVTDNPLDVALTGKGFLAVNGPTGALYTRNGSLRLASDGKLITSDGNAVRGVGGQTLTLDSGRPVEIASDGTVSQDGTLIGQLEIADFNNTAGLSKQGSNYFRITDSSLRPVAASGTLVHQGKLEGSNTGSAEGAVRLVSVMRQFEMLQKAAGIAGDMNRKAVEEVARVGA